jgi:hypothetical protein
MSNKSNRNKLIGVNNSDLKWVRSFIGNKVKTYFGKALATTQSTSNQGDVVTRVKTGKLPESTVTITINNK